MRFASKTFRRRRASQRTKQKIPRCLQCRSQCRICKTRRVRRKQRGGAVLPYTDPFHQMHGLVKTDASTDGLE